MEIATEQRYADVTFERNGKRCVSTVIRTCQLVSVKNEIEMPTSHVTEEFPTTLDELRALAAAHHKIGVMMSRAADDAEDYLRGIS